MIKILLGLLTALIFVGCQNNVEYGSAEKMYSHTNNFTQDATNIFSQDTKVVDVIAYKNFKNFGRLIFPVNRGIDKNLTLKNLDDVLIWYSHVNPSKTVEIVNYMKAKLDTGEKIFFDIYTDAEKKSDPRKNDTGLFFFRGKPMKSLPFAMQEAAFTTSAQCMTVFRMRWKFLNAATMPLH